LIWPKIDNFATCLAKKDVSKKKKKKKNNFVTALRDASKVEKGFIDR